MQNFWGLSMLFYCLLLLIHYVALLKNQLVILNFVLDNCDRICEKVPFSHIKFDQFFQLSNFVTFVSLQACVCNFP